MSARFAVALVSALAVLPAALSGQAATPDPEMRRPIDAFDTVWIEEMTWLEVRDALRAGRTTVLVPTGGIEQNGPWLVTGKHNVIVRTLAERIARKLGDALVAPVVGFVPEGDLEPPSGHMRYPGTISVSQATFRALLADVARSLRAHGFRHILFIGDSGGNQEGMKQVADSLAAEWRGGRTAIHFVPEYYDNPRWNAWLAEHGVHETAEGLHDDVRHSAILMVADPNTVRMEQRQARGLFSINGVALAPLEKTVALGNALIDYQADVTIAAIRRARGY